MRTNLRSGHLNLMQRERLSPLNITGLWFGDLGIMSMENMAYGTYRFMTNMKSVLEGSQDIRSTFWKSWIGMNHISYKSSETKGVKVVQVIEGTPADGVFQEGDIITTVNGCDVRSYDELEEKVTSMEPLKVLKIEYLRSGTVEVAELVTVPFGQRQEPVQTSSK
ncbi:MAG: PDZ domain-containing protein [Bacillota bacterium]